MMFSDKDKDSKPSTIGEKKDQSSSETVEGGLEKGSSPSSKPWSSIRSRRSSLQPWYMMQMAQYLWSEEDERKLEAKKEELERRLQLEGEDAKIIQQLAEEATMQLAELKKTHQAIEEKLQQKLFKKRLQLIKIDIEEHRLREEEEEEEEEEIREEEKKIKQIMEQKEKILRQQRMEILLKASAKAGKGRKRRG